MFQQGLLPNQSLGKENKGRSDPVIPNKRPPRAELRYFLGKVIEKPAVHEDLIVWKSDKPVWVNQYPLIEEKLQDAPEVVQKKLDNGHITPSNSPWNSPISVINNGDTKRDLNRYNLHGK